MGAVVKPDGTAELVECLDILMSALETGVDGTPPEFTEEEFQTALWQTVQLAMTLLFDNLNMQSVLDDIAKDVEERMKVGEIIRPTLDDVKSVSGIL